MVCEVQYGGRITDDLDRELFITYGEYWLSDNMFNPGFKFCPIQGNMELNLYCIPQESEHAKILEYLQELPKQDSPLVFGLHPNADLTY